MILLLQPHFEVKPWGGKKLEAIYDCPANTGEAWIVSGYRNKASTIINGKYKGKTLRWLWTNHQELFGFEQSKEFPLLIKIISSSKKLSVQVHPNDDYAIKNHNQLGKFECWYILPENEATKVVLGVNVKNALELRKIIDNKSLETYLIEKKIEADDLVIVDFGRVHALQENSFVLEVQEASDLTYRLYDYDREPRRELHIEDSLNVIDYNNDKNNIHKFKNQDVYKNSHFNIYKLLINNKKEIYENKGYEIFYVIAGEGTIDNLKIKKGDCFIITVDSKNIIFEGNLELIAVIPKKKDMEKIKMRKVALITGIIGQDGYYLSKLLLSKDYEVHGMIQSKTQLLSSSLIELVDNENFFTHIGDMTDTSNLNRLLEKIKPDEIYHLASQSHVDLSFEIPEYTTQVNALGTLRLLDAIKSSEIRTRLFHLSTPYLFSGEIFPQNENTPFEPQSPFAISKLYAHEMVKNYRECFNIYAVNGICYNHTSPKRDISFVSKKIIEAVKRVRSGENIILELGNLDSTREWGNTKEYAYAMWLSLQQQIPQDYIISTGIAYTVRDFVSKAYEKIGINLIWCGKGIEEVAKDENGRVLVRVNQIFLRPNDAKVLLGDSKKFTDTTGFQLKCDLDKLIEDMLEE